MLQAPPQKDLNISDFLYMAPLMAKYQNKMFVVH